MLSPIRYKFVYDRFADHYIGSEAYKGRIMDRVILGGSGVEVSRLAIGTGTNGWAGASAQTRIGKHWLTDTLIAGLDYGVTFWDLADEYGSHPFAARALRKINRSSVQIMTKTTSAEYETCWRDVRRFLKELGTDYIDVVLLHGMTSKDWNTEGSGAIRALTDAKASGAVGAVGVSCHNFAAVKVAAGEPWVEILLARINYKGENMDASPKRVVPILREAFDNGKGIVGMKVFGCGSLVRDTQRAVKWVLGLGTVHAITIGPTDDGHLEQNVRLVERFAPLKAPRSA